jgi:hypothetical protein
MKILAKFTGKVLKFNTDGASQVRLTDLSNGKSCDTDGITSKLKDAGIDYDGCDFEVMVIEEDGRPKGIMKKLDAPPAQQPVTSSESSLQSQFKF